MHDEDDLLLFRKILKDVVPLKKSERHPAFQKKTMLPSSKITFAKRIQHEEKNGAPNFVMSDFKDHWVDGDAPLFFAKNGISSELLRKIKRQNVKISRWLDLHGLTVHEALDTTEKFIRECHENAIRHVGLIHGKGFRGASKKPILKNALNDWLREHPGVLAFLSTTPKNGGGGALHVLLKISGSR
jgi:DNA-nicking Smr family endonuclease